MMNPEELLRGMLVSVMRKGIESITNVQLNGSAPQGQGRVWNSFARKQLQRNCEKLTGDTCAFNTGVIQQWDYMNNVFWFGFKSCNGKSAQGRTVVECIGKQWLREINLEWLLYAIHILLGEVRNFKNNLSKEAPWHSRRLTAII